MSTRVNRPGEPRHRRAPRAASALAAVFAIAVAGWATPAGAQSYQRAVIPYTWIDPSAHARLTAFDGTAGCPDTAGDDSVSLPLDLGFTFRLGSTAYTRVRINTNGRLQFGSAYCNYGTAAVGPPRTYPDPYPRAQLDATLKVYQADLDLTASASATLRYATVGTAPNRTFVVTWSNVPAWSATGTNYNLQVRLNEDGTFVYSYGPYVDTSGQTAVGNAEIGWQVTASDFVVVQQGLPAAKTSWRFAPTAPLAEYRFDEARWSGVAGEVTDSARGYNAVAANGATTAYVVAARSGSPGTCAYAALNGQSQYVQLPASLPRPSGTFTISAWVRTTHDWSSQKDMRIWVDDDSGDGYALSLGDGGAQRLRFFARRPSLVLLDSSAVVQRNTWYFVAVAVDTEGSQTATLYVFDATGALVDRQSTAVASFQPGSGRVAVGGELDGAPDGEGVARWRFLGSIDEVRYHLVALSESQLSALAGVTRPCSSGLAAFRIQTPSTGLYCLDQSVTVTALDGGGASFPAYSGTVTLSTGTGRGTWLLQSGGGTLSDPTPDDGVASYAFPGGQASATFSLRYRGGPALVTPAVTDGTARDDGSGGTITFSPSGFTVTSTPLSAPVTSVPAFTGSLTAGTNQPVYLTAYGQTPTDATCGVIAGYTGAKQLKFWLTRSEPATGTVSATVNASSIAAAEASAAEQAVTFSSGQATVTLKYKDVGRIALSMKDDTTGNPSLPTGIRGTTGTFVSKPADFSVTNVRRTSDGGANPGATTATGTVFLAAGRAFTATVTALDAEGSTTPNFGRESTPESVRFTTQLVLPASGNAPAVTGSFGAFASGTATGTAFAWNEVGTMRLVPRIADGDYLASGDVVGTATSPVGRFVPDRFEVAINTPLFQTGCAAGGFTYVGQPFTYSVAPVITATAVALGGTTTANYTGSLFRMTSASLGAPVYAASGYTLDTSGLPAAGTDPTIVDAGGGVARLTYSAGTGLALARTTPVAPFTPAITLSDDVVDLDGVRAASTVVFGASGGILFTGGATQRYGRVAVRGAAGSELLDLPVRTVVQYWLDAARGFTTASDDQCTVAPSITLRDWKRNLAAGETCVRDSGSPGTSGAGCPAAAVVSQRYRSTASAGDFNLVLAAPGAGNSGAVTVEAVAPAWLKFDWNVATPGLENPSALATFGVFQGSSQRVYEREVY